MNSQTNTRRTTPSTEFRCVWMLAGVLSYQLCNRDFDCDNCPLDSAMRKQFPSSHGRSRIPPQGIHHATGRRYSRNHCWLQTVTDHRRGSTGEKTDIVRVGIEPGLAHLLVSPKEIVLQQPGSSLVKGKTCLWIVLDGGTFPLQSPQDGIVHAINPLVMNQVHEWQLHPLTHGWLFEMEVPSHAVSPSLLVKGSEAERFYADDYERFKEMLAEELAKKHPDIGLTLQDGGRAASDVASVIGPERYLQILREVFRTIRADFQI